MMPRNMATIMQAVLLCCQSLWKYYAWLISTVIIRVEDIQCNIQICFTLADDTSKNNTKYMCLIVANYDKYIKVQLKGSRIQIASKAKQGFFK